MAVDPDLAACIPHPVTPRGFNPRAAIPYGLTTEAIYSAMVDFVDFLDFINLQLNSRGIVRLERMMMQANFSSLVGEFVKEAIPKYAPTVVKNLYHNGHPDLLPTGLYPGNAAQHVHEGIEVKAFRHVTGWQGHNLENIWLMVFVFDANSAADEAKGSAPKPFRFLQVLGARLEERDWTFSGRSATSRRTITASVNQSGYRKISANWIYRDTG